MKINYNKLMQEEISSFGGKPKLLLHCCCAPCSSAVIEKLKQHFEITFFYYNPNIFPEDEYILRKNEFKKLNVNVLKSKELSNAKLFFNVLNKHVNSEVFFTRTFQ